MGHRPILNQHHSKTGARPSAPVSPLGPRQICFLSCVGLLRNPSSNSILIMILGKEKCPLPVLQLLYSSPSSPQGSRLPFDLQPSAGLKPGSLAPLLPVSSYLSKGLTGPIPSLFLIPGLFPPPCSKDTLGGPDDFATLGLLRAPSLIGFLFLGVLIISKGPSSVS